MICFLIEWNLPINSDLWCKESCLPRKQKQNGIRFTVSLYHIAWHGQRLCEWVRLWLIHRSSLSTQTSLDLADFDCFERADAGPGRAYIESYAWQPRTRTCQKFIFGGMLGNRNRFTTVEECDRSCHDAVLRAFVHSVGTHRSSSILF